MTETELRQKVAATAQKYLGCKESDGSHRKIIDCYNSHKPLARGYAMKYTDAWCATFVSAVSIELGLTDIMPTECGCPQMIALYQKLGRWQENENYTPKPGDVIFYDWQDGTDYVATDNKGSPDHVGIVVGISGSIITVVEGNKNNTVGMRTVKINGKYIRGYGIHGTVDPDSVGTPSSAGCVRLRNEQVEELFDFIPEPTAEKTRVVIVE